MTKKISKNKITLLNFAVGVSILLTFAFILKNIFYNYAIETNVNKARVITQELLATRHYLAKIAPHTKINNKKLNKFAISPAVVGSHIGKFLEKKKYVYLKQTSIRYRNIQNAPDKFEKNILQRYKNKKIQGEYHEISKINGKENLRYTYPLYIQKSCLACHGTPYVDVKKDIYDNLVKVYGKRSFNYKEGDLRGIISVAINIEDINKTLTKFNNKIFLMLFLLFLVMMLFLYLEKKYIYEPQLQQIQELNSTLESRIKEEVEKNREKEKQLLQQSRLAQMGEMISMIAHQWRQPLSAISSASSSLELKAMLGKADNETVKEISKKISNYAQHLSTTIDDFRNFFKKNKTKNMTNFKHLVESTLSIVENSLISKGIEVVVDLKDDKEFLTYENEIKQVILNLIKNAEDILLEKEIENPVIELHNSCGINGKTPTLLIKDNGGGVPSHILEKIFYPYFSTKTKKDGTGLGLYMSKTIIEDHCHGKLSVYNEDNGAVFKIEFTLEEEKQ